MIDQIDKVIEGCHRGYPGSGFRNGVARLHFVARLATAT